MEEQKKGGGCPGPTRGFDPMTFIYEIYPYRISKMYLPGASLGWVTPGAATEGNRPSIFSWKTWRPFFAHRCHYHYRFLLLSCGCHPPPPRVSPHTFFYLSDLVSPLFFVNLPTISPPHSDAIGIFYAKAFESYTTYSYECGYDYALWTTEVYNNAAQNGAANLSCYSPDNQWRRRIYNTKPHICPLTNL